METEAERFDNLSEGFKPEVRLPMSFTVATNGRGQHSGFFHAAFIYCAHRIGRLVFGVLEPAQTCDFAETILAFLVS